MSALEDCYCPRCSRYKPFSQVAHSTKVKHRTEFGPAAVERPLSSQFLNEFGPGPSPAHQTNAQPISGSEDPSDDRSQSNSSNNDPDADMDSSGDSSSDGDSICEDPVSTGCEAEDPNSQMDIYNRLDSDTCTNGGESAGVVGSLHADHLDDIDMHDGGNSQELADGCLDPIRLDNIILTGSTQDDQVINSYQSLDLPDPGSQTVVSRSPSPEPLLDNNSSSGPDIEELCGIVEDEDLALYLGFITLLRNSSLDDASMQMEVEDLERLRNPPRYGINLESEPDLRLALDLFLANYTSSVDAYNQNRKAMLWRHPEDDVYTYDQAKRLVQHLSGIVPLAHDMCINTCIAYTGPFSILEICPYCNTPRYNPVVPGKSSEKKAAQRVFHTMPIGPQLQAFYRSKESAEKMKYAENKLQEIVDEALNAEEGTQPDFEDWCHGADFLQAFHEGRIKKGDPILMFSIDGAQLYRSKTSDCWMYIWVILNLDPATGRYKKAAVLFGGIIPGPNKPKILESFLFPGLHHLSAIQKEGLPIWDASTNTFYVSNPYMAVACADGPAMAYINGLVGHQGKVGCRLYCPMKGRLKGSHYYPVCLKPESADATSNHPDVQPAEYAHKTFFNYENQLKYVTESPNKTQYKNRRLETGIVKPGIFLGLQPEHTHTIPRCFGYDIMHLISLNIPELLLSLWRGTIETSDRDDRISWDFAVLQGPVWKNHGTDVASMTPYLPGSFDRPPRNPAEKINSGYKAWEYLMYIYGLGPGLFYHVLPKPYWQNMCRVVRGIRIAHQYKISVTSLKQAHQFFLDFVLEFEELYYKRQPNRIHFVRPCIHLLIHIAPEVLRAGPGVIASQWVMERAIGDLGREIKLPSNPFANLSQRAVLRCQVNVLKAILPELDEPKNLLPRGALNLHGGYVLLRARESSPSFMINSAAVALRTYYEREGQQLTDNGTGYRVIRWARLRIPTGQIARSAWKEKLKSASNVRMARNVKLKVNSAGEPEFAEVQYYFQMLVKKETRTLALVSKYPSPDAGLLKESFGTLWAFKKQTPGEEVLTVIDVKSIVSVVCIAPLPRSTDGMNFLCEKPGLDVAEMGGLDEELTEE